MAEFPTGPRHDTPPPPPRALSGRDPFQLVQSILESMGDGIVVADEDGRFLLFNPAAERILGIGSTDVLPGQWAETYGVFVQRMLREPELPDVSAVILDEFHERTLEADLALAWLKALRRATRRAAFEAPVTFEDTPA